MALFGKKEKLAKPGWEVNCAPECGFMARDYDQKDLVKVLQTHTSNMHGKAMTEKEILGMAKAI